MTARLSRRITSAFIDYKIITEADREIYDYSVEVVASTIFNFILVGIISILTKMPLEIFLYLLTFIPLRAMAGGYHADTHFRCSMILVVSQVLFVGLVRFLPSDLYRNLAAILSLFFLLVIFMLAPVEDANKPLSPEEKIKFKKLGRISGSVMVMGILILLISSANPMLPYCCSLGVATVGFSLLASMAKKQIIRLNRKTMISSVEDNN